jgi:hypothetical protein
MQRMFLLMVVLGSSALLSCTQGAAQSAGGTSPGSTPTVTSPVDTTGGASNAVAKFADQNTMVNSSIIDDDGSVRIGDIDTGQVAFSPDNIDTIQSTVGEAGPQMHFRLSRAYCDKRSRSKQSSFDQANFFCTPDANTIDDTHLPYSVPFKSLIIAPYKFGMELEYPGLFETFTQEFSIHNSHVACSGPSCDVGAHLWVGDVHDVGGILATAFDTLSSDNTTIDRSQSFVSITSQTFHGDSHGDMLFALRDSQDNFRFQFGPLFFADAPATYKQFTKARIDSTGKGFFDGGTQTGGADFAESVSTSGVSVDYEPGDVLVIDTTADRQFSLSTTPYSKLVAGVYSTKPGVLGTLHASEDPDLTSELPMAVVGIVPCKVSTENGPISRGDLLVTSTTPGYAMRATDATRLSGTIIGKALQPLLLGKGKIEVLITLH